MSATKPTLGAATEPRTLASSHAFVETCAMHPDRRHVIRGLPSAFVSQLRALLLTDVVDSTKLSLRVGRRDGQAVGRA